MFIFYFISNKRIGQLVAQINPNIPTEKTRNNTISGETDLGIKIKPGKLFEVLGISGELLGEIKGDIIRISENKYKIHEESIATNLYKYLKKKENYTLIDEHSDLSILRKIKNLIRFKGYFRPLIPGKDVSEMIDNYNNVNSVYWEGKCGIITIKFLTTKDSIPSSTPVISCFHSDNTPTFMEGFGTFFKISNTNTVEILPLFIGLELK